MGKSKAKAAAAAAAATGNSSANASKTTAKASLDALFAAKKVSAKVPKDAPKGKHVAAAPPAAKQTDKQSAKNQLDALFSGIKVKKQQKIDEDKAVRRQEEKEHTERLAYRKHLEALEAEHKRKNNDTSDPRPVRYDADGLAIYSEESLRLNQGGDTADCPFDCWCCF